MVATEFHDAPNWLTEAYLEPVLRKYKNDPTLQIKNLIIMPATAKGENYASVMTRTKVYFKQSDSSELKLEQYIVKTSYENDPSISAVFDKYDLYNTEMIMYEKILPQMTALLEEIGDDDKLFAGTVHVDYERSAIIFEDLAVPKYTTLDRIVGMNELQVKLALKKLAKMHATAAVLDERQPGWLSKFDHGMFNRYTRGIAAFFINMVGVCAEFAGNCPELGEYYKQKLLKLQVHTNEYAARCFDPKPGFFHTLNHGDFWINNVMVRFDSECAKKIADMKIIDFQFCVWANPAIDLHYFFNTSLQPELRFERQGELVKYYHEILSDTLRKLKFGGFIPSLHQFNVQFEADRFLAVTSSLACGPLMINDKTEDADFNGVIKDDERGRRFRRMLYDNQIVQDYMKKLLPMFDAKGLLDSYQ